jgi:hypothetical protein
MGKALLAVGAFLSVCFLIFGGAVFLSRDEDHFAVDNLLAEKISREVLVAGQENEPLDFRLLTPFDWDRVLITDIGTPRGEISRALGFPFKGELQYTAESSKLFIFTNRGQFVRFADYRGRRPFAGLERPMQWFTANDAIFRVRDGIVRPAG